MTQPPSPPSGGPQLQQQYPYGQPQQQQQFDEPPVPTARLAWAFFLFSPIGIVALLRQIRAVGYWSRGDQANAAEWSSRARSLTTTALIVGGVFWVLFFLIYFVSIIVAISTATAASY